LRDVGSEAYALLPAEVGDYILELESDAGDRGISLDFTFPSDMALLWEMMYIGDPTEPTDLQKFWGFRYPIGHLYWESDVRPTVALHEGVYTLSHDSLIHTKQELESLKHKLETLREQFIAAVCYLEEDTTLICEAMDVEMLMRHFNSQIFRYGVVHFACHCDNAEGAGASQAYLSVTAHQQEVMITLGKLNALARHRRGFRYRPLVFLNACESATPLHLLQSLNFPSSLLKFGAGGVIATNCVMPDNFASAFATKFYETLLNKPLNASPAYIGETLLETRKHFAETYRNPLGLAYGLYAVSDQEFRLLG
jgi:hypothetical protein